MKIWYLSCSSSQEYAVVFAANKEDAFNKLQSHRKLYVTDIKFWKIEEFTEQNYDGVLYFY